MAALPADTLVARAEFTGDGDSAYVLVASYSNASDASTGPVARDPFGPLVASPKL